MIDTKFWQKIADNWRTDSDGIDIPDIPSIDPIIPEDLSYDGNDDEVDDILASLGLDI